MYVRPHVLLSVATSIDGYIDDLGADRLLLSNAADFDRVDSVRAGSDAILIGAGTIRADNPRLLVNSAERRKQRVADGKPEYPLKVTVTGSGDLPADAKFWHHGGDKLAYTTDSGRPTLTERLGDLAVVHSLGPSIDFAAMLDDLGSRGIGRLMVEGGGSIHTALLAEGLADEIHMVVAPLLVGQPDAPRFLHPTAFPGGPRHRMVLAESTQIGDVTLMRFLPGQPPDA
ncbi:5-amino-6-(5-phosphoribosylamino)uracil reductase [Pseudonocardia sp. Ae168_Ps1]|uniref:RibD family protein n=1 Tax=Pseudonocardia sp. Ae168_Ps1 TaxID=1885029 RepID=UPI00095B265E|nr:dihydrofolate reductase family protein [Pseudonocardia sp. Ae168_Ps1]OLL74340.1 5-amino-6-(5-phosphoribosylamino)uracil reductase [Pseudonocardia sp. Ae150A_Ps1]OLL80322.1 5-amino-6-(5-phosphoribosylamino)uracil reductase [Pseudonocardia sp. Ae168_Ps1]OLL85552.1 5-amino-6-(5-phosphoribosylamino)uracil reductase [Pseudonocardia sp. Ae263_Ps1]OLL94420.1 5-amino-6-(5-phosphoribosylamino)uracil reductase [Pseudonocardia sp. Ae356_Ps1]